MTVDNDQNWLKPEDEKIELTYEGLLASKKLLCEQRELGNPNYKYKGNCTKAFADAVVEKHFKEMWAHVKSISLPSSQEFPFTEKQLANEIKNLVKNDNSWKTRSALIRKFHRDTFNNSNRKGSLTPNQFWAKLQNDEALFKKFYHNRLRCSDWFNEKDKTGKYKDNRPYLVIGVVPNFILSIGIDTARKAPLVSYFKPALAKYLVKKYLSQFDEVYDPFSGMSGRLLGTIAAGKKYIGRDINDMVISESKKLMMFADPIFKTNNIKSSWNLQYADAMQTIGEYQCVLMCPPYGASEQWNGIKSDISCDQWLDIITSNIKAKRYVAVVDDTIVRYKSFIKESLENFSHFGTNIEYVVVLDQKDLVTLQGK